VNAKSPDFGHALIGLENHIENMYVALKELPGNKDALAELKRTKKMSFFYHPQIWRMAERNVKERTADKLAVNP